ncbi:ester cyclase [Aspergillus novofumigatus IBT 16806]|uniref:SnoaL-domain-containing protein n=1 Tax=Aspergillus novofumigatus (strain IBT 16806) TaxID=1392255 RepID=A0A2I1C0Y3_ASPN1|nr:SnoaL-domain-containing protein [Aspergillus novofumigatus IBT 16806]PKX91233.1 SnoaL-domain-containing protein [Aspergillus novofumigatus IBT 16806]
MTRLLLLPRMRRFVDFINSSDETIGREVVSESAVFHVPFSDTPLKGLSGYMQILATMRSAFPDIQWTLDDTVIEDDRVVAQFTLRGSHEGQFFGVPASGKKIQAQAMNIYRFTDGMIVEETGLPDLFGIMLQIGAVNPMGTH